MQNYLVTYGADNDMFFCEADSATDAIRQFHESSDEPRGDVNSVFLATEVTFTAPHEVCLAEGVVEYAGVARDGTFFAADDLRVLSVHRSQACSEQFDAEESFKEMK